MSTTMARFAPGDRVRYMRHMGRFLATVVAVHVESASMLVRVSYTVRMDEAWMAAIERHPVPERWLEPVGPLEELSFCGDAERVQLEGE